MLLTAKELLVRKTEALLDLRQSLEEVPGLALVWVGNDEQTGFFVRLKQRTAQKFECQLFLHHFEQAETRQLDALILGLNQRKDIHGIVLQLPLPSNVDRDHLISLIDPVKDIDDLRGQHLYTAPTAQGIVDLLLENKIDPSKRKTIIIGDGLLVGHPLSEIFTKNNWPFCQITRDAEKEVEKIHEHDLLIACTGQPNLITPTMVHSKMVVVDGSGVDVDLGLIEPLVEMITPAKGAVGPLTVSNLFTNLLSAVGRHDRTSQKSR